jgi:hypothetical protein
MKAVVLVACLLASACGPSLQRTIETTVSDGRYEVPTTDTARCRDAVAQLFRTSPVPVARVDAITGQDGVPLAAVGAANGEGLWLIAGLSSCAELEVLSHERAHLLQPNGLTVRERQLFADVVSYEVVKRLGGYDPRASYARVLARYKMDARLLTLYEAEIKAAVLSIIAEPK